MESHDQMGQHGREQWVHIRRGWPVYDSDGRGLGNISEVAERYCFIKDSPAFGRDIFIPRPLVDHVEGDDHVFLNKPASDIKNMGLYSKESMESSWNQQWGSTGTWQSGQTGYTGSQGTDYSTRPATPPTGTGGTEYTGSQGTQHPGTEGTGYPPGQETAFRGDQGTDSSTRQGTTYTGGQGTQGTPYGSGHGTGYPTSQGTEYRGREGGEERNMPPRDANLDTESQARNMGEPMTGETRPGERPPVSEGRSPAREPIEGEEDLGTREDEGTYGSEGYDQNRR